MTSYDVTNTPKITSLQTFIFMLHYKVDIRPDCVVNVIKNKGFNEVKNLNFQVLRKIKGPVDKKPITAEIIYLITVT